MKKYTFLRAFSLLAGLLLMAGGVWREEVPMIFMKAVNVCFQCIGIG